MKTNNAYLNQLVSKFKKLIKYLPLQFTKNQRYDVQTRRIIAQLVKPNTHCIDIGCHQGEIMDIILQYAPSGMHYAFEPIPELFKQLQVKYKNRAVSVYDIALSNVKGVSNFNYVVSNPAYSGLIKRKYDHKNEIDQQIKVKTDRLDDLIPEDMKIDLLKIDVEGGELQVLEGAKRVIKNNLPYIIFEHGLGASEFYEASPDKVYRLLVECGLTVSNLDAWLHNLQPLTQAEFENQFYHKLNYYFIAHPIKS